MIITSNRVATIYRSSFTIHHSNYPLMKKNHFFFLVFIGVAFFLSSCATEKYKAYRNIQQLSEGVLLVRLKTKEKTIAKYQELGMKDRAKATRVKQEAENAEILTAFDKIYQFSSVYFFYSDESKKLREKDFKSLQLFDMKQNPVDAAFLRKKYFLIAEFGRSYDTEFVVENSKERRSAGGAGAVDALIVMDKDFVQLERPFPHTTENILKIGKSKMVQELDLQLQRKKHTLEFWWNKKKLRGKDKVIEAKVVSSEQ